MSGATVHPPFYCTYGLGIELGERTFIGQACSLLDLGGITIGDRAMISPKVTLVTALPGVRIGHDAVVGAGAVVAKDVAPMTVVTGAGQVERRRLDRR